MNQLVQAFDFNGASFTVLIIDGEPHWIAKEVCTFLGIVNSKDAVSSLRENIQKKKLSRADLAVVGLTSPPSSGINELNLLTEAGLYKLIFKSRKPEAEAFSDWVSSEVLPQIRRTGRFELQPKSDEDQVIIEAMDILHKRVRQQALQLEHKDRQLELAKHTIQQQAPKVRYVNDVLQSGSLISITTIAKELGMSGMMLNQRLHELEIQYKQNGVWVLYAAYQDKGYTVI